MTEPVSAPLGAPPRDDGSPSEMAIAEAVRAARRDGRRVRVRGGGVSALPPPDGAVTVDVSRHRGIVDLRPSDGVLTVRAGTPLAEIAATLHDIGRRLCLAPWDPGGATIGGAVAAAADGLAARNGARWRDVVLGARAVLGTGEITETGARVVKSVAGLDVPKALVGSRGTIAAITCLHLRIELLPEMTSTLSSEPVRARDVERLVASCDALSEGPTACVVEPSSRGWARGRDGIASAADEDAGGGPACVLHVRVEGHRAAVRATAARLGSAGLRPAHDPDRLWARLTADAAAPPPAGLIRRVSRCSRTAPAARFGANRAGGWVADLLRSRVTWIDTAPAPGRSAASAGVLRGDPAVAALFDRVRRAFDPDGVFAPGRGYGAP